MLDFDLKIVVYKLEISVIGSNLNGFRLWYNYILYRNVDKMKKFKRCISCFEALLLS